MRKKTQKEIEIDKFLARIREAGQKAHKENEESPEYINYKTELVDVCDLIRMLRLFPEFHGELWTRAEAEVFESENFDMIYFAAALVVRDSGWTFEEFQDQLRNYPPK
jgi:hypothetical protein